MSLLRGRLIIGVISLIMTLALSIALSGCKGRADSRAGASAQTPVKMQATLEVKVEGFEQGERIPDRYTCHGQDLAPSIRWRGLPSEAKSLVIIVSDPDAPGGTFYHLVLYDVPVTLSGLPEGFSVQQLRKLGIKVGKNDFGVLGYNGPCPPPGRPHRYYFRVYALDVESLGLPDEATAREVLRVIKEHVLAIGEYMGTFSSR